MLSMILNTVETLKCKKGIGIFRKWNREDIKIFHTNFYKNRDAKTYMEQMKDTVIETMLQFVGYQNIEFVDNFFNNPKTELFTFFHTRVDEKNRKFEGTTLSFILEISKNRFDKIDLIFEDIAVDSIFDGEVNQVRLYISPLIEYGSNSYELLYWDSSDRKSLDIFQTAYLDNIIFFKRDKTSRYFNLWHHKFLNNFQKREIVPKTSSF